MATALEMLLARLAAERGGPIPEPAAPMSLGPLSTDTSAAFAAQNPEPVPPRLIQPTQPDQGFVNQYAGPAPVAPTVREPGLLERILTTIGGVGAGLQGNAAPYTEQIRQQRQEPIRRFEREQAQFEDRRTRGLELAERRAEREAAQANRALEQQYENEFKVWLSKNSDRSDEAKQKMAQAFTLERDARAARLEAEREQQRERRQLERDARAIEERYFTASKNRALSRELGRHWAGLSSAPLSPAAARLDAKLAGVGEARMQRAAGGGGTGGGTGSGTSPAVENTLAEFETLKQMAIQGVKSAGGTPQDEIEAVRRATSGVVRKMARQPRLFEVGTGQFGFPYAKPRGGAGQQPVSDVRGASPEGFPLAVGTPGGPQVGPSDDEVKAYAKRFKISPTKARQELAGQ